MTIELMLYTKANGVLLVVLRRRMGLFLRPGGAATAEFPFGLLPTCGVTYGPGQHSSGDKLDMLWTSLDVSFGTFDFMQKRDEGVVHLFEEPGRLVVGYVISPDGVSNLSASGGCGLEVFCRRQVASFARVAPEESKTHDARSKNTMVSCHVDAALKGFDAFKKTA
jgi:hypothetical protein